MKKGLRYSEVPGRLVRLDDVRVVFVAEHQDVPNRKMIAMRNEDGEDTTFSLSIEAADALAALLSSPTAGDAGPMPPRPKLTPMRDLIMGACWQLVAEIAATPTQESDK